MGSKNRIAKEILPIMLSERQEEQYWVEPFVGGGNMIDKITGNRIGADNDWYVIDALTKIRDNPQLLPKDNIEFTEKEYKDRPRCGYVAFALSYGGKKWGGWCRDGAGKRDYVSEAYRNAQRQSHKLQGIELVHSDYRELNIPENS